MNSKKIQTQLKNIRIKSRNTREKERVWKNVRLSMSSSTMESRKPRFSTFKKSIAIALIFGMTSGVAFAADGAKPGDTLFALDRALENFQLFIASEDKKDELKVKFALERVSEVKNIFKEISVEPTETTIKTYPVETTENIPTVPQENTEQTEPKEEETESPNSVSQEEIVATQETEEIIQAQEATSTNFVVEDYTEGQAASSSSEINLDEEDVERPSEEVLVILADISDGDKERIELALGIALSFLGDVKGELVVQGNDDAVSYIDFMLEQLNKEIDTLPGNVTFEINLSSKKERVKFEITSEDGKPEVQIEIEEKLVEGDGDTSGIAQPEEEATIQTKTLEIKDGSLSIITGGESSDDTDEEDVVEKNSTEEIGDAKEETTTNEEELSTTTQDIIESEEVVEEDNTETIHEEEDGTTTVKVIIKKLENNFELSIIDKDTGVHNLIEDLVKEETGSID